MSNLHRHQIMPLGELIVGCGTVQAERGRADALTV